MAKIEEIISWILYSNKAILLVNKLYLNSKLPSLLLIKENKSFNPTLKYISLDFLIKEFILFLVFKF